MRKKDLALAVIDRLKNEYPATTCTLDYDDAWKLLVSVRLAAQCTDARVNEIVPNLYEKYPGINELADADVEDIESIVKPCGLGRSKARDISACMKMLRDTYNGHLIMGDIYKKPAIVTDTHCIRLSNRIGLVDNIKEPKKVELALLKIIPPEESNDLCHRFVDHGRAVCTARTTPYCDRCVLNDICRKNI